MKKRTSKLLSLLLTLSMVLGMLPAMSMTAAAYTEGEIAGTTGTCLLYTSPSPRDRTRSRMPSSA